MSIFIHDCIECQQKNTLIKKSKQQQYKHVPENASYFNYRISMDTKEP